MIKQKRRSQHLYSMGMHETFCFIATTEYDTHVRLIADSTSLIFGEARWSLQAWNH